MTISQLWPPTIEPRLLFSGVRDAGSASSLPAVGRALALFETLLSQMPLDQVKPDGERVPVRPPVLTRPDPLLTRSNFIKSMVRDYLLSGNACAKVIARDARGFPSSLRYVPAHQWGIPTDGGYLLQGKKVDAGDVIHVQRGTDPSNSLRGIGVVEQHLRTLDRVGLQEAYETDSLSKAGVPSVAVIAPQRDLTEEQADAAADRWEDKFSGPKRRPAILPNGTDVKTLAWSPEDQQMVLARQLSLVDVANIFNLDAYWLGGSASGLTYKSSAPMFTSLIRTSLAGVITPFEEAFTRVLVPHGSEVKFDRLELTRDDFASEVLTGKQAVDAGLITVDEWRIRQGLSPIGTEETQTLRTVSSQKEPEPEPEPQEDTQDQEDSEDAEDR